MPSMGVSLLIEIPLKQDKTKDLQTDTGGLTSQHGRSLTHELSEADRQVASAFEATGVWANWTPGRGENPKIHWSDDDTAHHIQLFCCLPRSEQSMVIRNFWLSCGCLKSISHGWKFGVAPPK